MERCRVIGLSLKCTCLFSLIFLTFFPIIINGHITYEEDVTLTLKQKEALDEFRKLMIDRVPHDYMKKDIYLLKWLRAAHFNVKKANEMILQNLKWREIEKMDTIHDEDWTDMLHDFKYYLDGRDKFGRSFLYFTTSDLSVRKTVIAGKGERLLRYVNKGIDEACNLVRNLGEKYHNVTRGHLLVNLKGFSVIEHTCIQCLPFLLRIPLAYQNNYPGCVDNIVLINAPSAVQPIVNIVRPVVDPDLWKQLRIYGYKMSEWKPELEKMGFDFAKLPREVGGSAVYSGMDPDY